MSLFGVFKKKGKASGETTKAPVSPAPAPVVAARPVAQPVSAVSQPSLRGAEPAKASVLLRRLVTEKAVGQASLGQYSFAVARSANKITIMRAITQRYGVKPLAVRVVNMRGSRVRFGRQQGMTGAWKKAIVQLPPGAKIEGEKAAT